MKKILIPLPTNDFDPTEAGVSFKILKESGHQICFATPNGLVSKPDMLMYTGIKLGFLKSILMADKNGFMACKEMMDSPEFQNPISYNQIDVTKFDGILLPGGHDKGMREYLESKELQSSVALFFELNKKIAAICHGVVLLARSISKNNSKSVIADYNVTSLLKKQELLAYHLTKLYLNDYYLTYNVTVEDEVMNVLNSKKQFHHGPNGKSYLGVALYKRDSLKNLENGFVVKDRNLITARWPGDVHKFATSFVELLKT